MNIEVNIIDKNTINENEYNIANFLITLIQDSDYKQLLNIMESLFLVKIDDNSKNYNEKIINIVAYLLKNLKLNQEKDFLLNSNYLFLRFCNNIHYSINSFAGKTLKSIDKKSEKYKKLYAQYSILCIKQKCIYVLDKYNNNQVLVCIDLKSNDGMYRHGNIRIYEFEELAGTLYLTYGKKYKKMLGLKNVIGEVKGFSSIKQLHKLCKFEQFEKLCQTFNNLIPNEYCFYCNCNEELISNNRKKIKRCEICDLIFKNLTETAPNTKGKLGKYKLFKTDTDHIVSNIKKEGLDFINRNSKLPALTKRTIVGNNILSYSKIKKNQTLLKKNKELLQNVTAENYLDLIAVIKEHYKTSITHDIPEFLKKYEFPFIKYYS